MSSKRRFDKVLGIAIPSLWLFSLYQSFDFAHTRMCVKVYLWIYLNYEYILIILSYILISLLFETCKYALTCMGINPAYTHYRFYFSINNCNIFLWYILVYLSLKSMLFIYLPITFSACYIPLYSIYIMTIFSYA